MRGIDEVKDAIEELTNVQTERIRAEERLKVEIETLKDLGFDSIDKATEGLTVLRGKREKKMDKFSNDYDEWVEDYGELLN